MFADRHSEGTADRAFFEKLCERHHLSAMYCPWPVKPEENAPEDAKQFYGKDKFVDMLKALGIWLIEIPDLKQKIKGIIIATDAGDDRGKCFKAVQKQIKKAGDFAIPDREMEVKAAVNGVPAIAVILIPTEGLGGLETLCIKAFSDASKTNQQLMECQKIYFECGPAKPKNWGVEKRDKAAFQCLVAASCKDNPSMSTAWVFSTRQGHEPVIDIAAPAFNEVVNAMRAIVAKMSR